MMKVRKRQAGCNITYEWIFSTQKMKPTKGIPFANTLTLSTVC